MNHDDLARPVSRRAALAGGLAITAAMAHPSRAEATGRKRARIIVSLADNAAQGIVPTTATLGDGSNARTNLYWGAMYGLKTVFKRSADYRVTTQSPLEPHVLDALTIEPVSGSAVIQAQAFDGRHQVDAVNAFYAALAQESDPFDHVIFVGHNALMDRRIQHRVLTQAQRGRNRARGLKASVIACQSRDFFVGPLDAMGAQSYVMTNGLMAPEGYVVEAVVSAWLQDMSVTAASDAAGEAYATYQKISPRAGRRLFAG